MATVAASNTATAAGSTTISQRLVSLDVFRGLTMASMVMVNNQGPGSYYQLEHASWHGLTFTDLVFPFFVWIVGVAMTLSTAKRVERGENKTQLLLHVAKRAAIIFLIGLGLNGFPSYDLAHLRIPGVLQRIAICYLIAGIIFLYSGLRGRVLWLIGCSALYWVLMAPHGYDKLTNFSAEVDRMVVIDGPLIPPHEDVGPGGRGFDTTVDRHVSVRHFDRDAAAEEDGPGREDYLDVSGRECAGVARGDFG